MKYICWLNIISFLWRVAKRLSYIEDAQCLKVKDSVPHTDLFVNETLETAVDINSFHCTKLVILA